MIVRWGPPCYGLATYKELHFVAREIMQDLLDFVLVGLG